MTLLRVGNYFAFHQSRLTWVQAWPALSLGLRFDLRVVGGTALAAIVWGAIPWFDPFRAKSGRRLWLTLVAVASFVLVVFYVGDFLHYRYLSQRLNASVLGFLGDARIAVAMAWQSYPLVRIALIVAATVAGLSWLAGRYHRRLAASTVSGPRGWKRTAWYTTAVCGCVVGMFGRIGQYPLRWSDAFNLRNDASANLALNPFQSFFSSLGFQGSGYDLERVRAHYPRMSEYLGVPVKDATQLAFAREVPAQPTLLAPAGGPPLNVVLVICESFSAYKSSMWGNPLDTTPFFAEIARQGVFFDNCFTPHVGTARGVWATITGLPDVEPQETASRNPGLVDQHTLINQFVAHEKLYFLGGSSSWANIRGLLTNNIQGLRLYEEGSYTSPRIDVWGISDKSLFLEANAVLRAQTKPFFAVIQTADNHRPYTIPAEDRKEFTLSQVAAADLKRGGFESIEELNAFRYTDFAFRKFFEAARKEAYFDRTLFVFIGDHGIGGDAGQMFPAAWTSGNLTRYHVPLLFYAPGRLPAQRLHAVASMVDVLPTIAGLAGIAYRNNALGRDLLRQQAIDGGRSNAAFVIDHHSKTMGVVHQSHLGTQSIAGGREELAWADFALPPPTAGAAEPAAIPHHELARGLYETSRYLLRHNRKPGGSGPVTSD
ncbi:LTA synthase family protein [Horticoccus sp. 23ND18S-11]